MRDCPTGYYRTNTLHATYDQNVLVFDCSSLGLKELFMPLAYSRENAPASLPESFIR